MQQFLLKLVAPDGIKYEEEADKVTLPTTEGQITILPGHMPLIAQICPGEIIIEQKGNLHHLSTEGGVAQITAGLVQILADTAQDAESLDELKIAEAKKAAQERLANAKDDVDFAEASAALEKQLAKLSFLERRKKYRK